MMTVEQYRAAVHDEIIRGAYVLIAVCCAIAAGAALAAKVMA
jgi:hypothetical protein